jgi:hypothetical protein
MKRALVLALSAGLTLLVLLVPALASAAVPYQVQWLDTQENPSCETADLGAHDGEPFFRVNDTPLPTFQIPGALVTNADGSETNGFKLIIGHISTARGSSCHRGPQERHVEAAPPPGNKFPGYTNEVCSPAGDHTEQHRPTTHPRGSEQAAPCTVSRRSPTTLWGTFRSASSSDPRFTRPGVTGQSPRGAGRLRSCSPGIHSRAGVPARSN